MARVFVGYDSGGVPIWTEGQDPTGGATGGMQPFYTGLEQQFGLQQGSLAQMAQVESGGNPNAQQGSYQGLFQMGPQEQAMFGITNPFNAQQSATGGAAYAAQNLQALPQDFGPYGGFDAYMAHQQGANGYGQLLAAGNDAQMSDLSRARQRNAESQRLKGYDPNTWTVGDFLGTFNTRYSTANNGQLWPDYSYNQQFATNGYPQGFNTGFDASGNAANGNFGMFGMQGTGTGFVDNSTFNSINQMMPQPQYGQGWDVAKGSMSGTGSGGGLVYDYSTGQYVPQSSQGTNGAQQQYNPQDLGFQQDYSGGFMGGQNTTGYMNLSGGRLHDTGGIGIDMGSSWTDPNGALFKTGDGSGFSGFNSSGVPIDAHGNQMPTYGGGNITVQPFNESPYASGGGGGYQDPLTGAFSDGSDVTNMASSANNANAAFAAANRQSAADADTLWANMFAMNQGIYNSSNFNNPQYNMNNNVNRNIFGMNSNTASAPSANYASFSQYQSY